VVADCTNIQEGLGDGVEKVLRQRHREEVRDAGGTDWNLSEAVDKEEA
jgi:hypothetical protein